MRVSLTWGEESKSRVPCVLPYSLQVPQGHSSTSERLAIRLAIWQAEHWPGLLQPQQWFPCSRGGMGTHRGETLKVCKGRDSDISAVTCVARWLMPSWASGVSQLCLRAWNLDTASNGKPQEGGAEFFTSPLECGERVKVNY